MKSVVLLGLCGLSCAATLAQETDDPDFDPSAIEEFAPVALAKGNELFLQASITARVNAAIRKTRTNPGSLAASVVQINMNGKQAGSTRLDVCSLTASAGSREVINSCAIGSIAVQGK